MFKKKVHRQPVTGHFKISKPSPKGDEVLLEWDQTVSTERLDEIEREFNELMKKGYSPANLETNELVKEFDPNANYLMIPRMQGGKS